jgi:hypothetical protein
MELSPWKLPRPLMDVQLFEAQGNTLTMDFASKAFAFHGVSAVFPCASSKMWSLCDRAKTTEANAGAPGRVPIRTRWAAMGAIY